MEKKRDFVWSVYKISDKRLGSRRIDWDIPNNWWQYITLIVSTRDHLTRVICGPTCYSLIYVSRETWKNASKLPSFFPLPRNSPLNRVFWSIKHCLQGVSFLNVVFYLYIHVCLLVTGPFRLAIIIIIMWNRKYSFNKTMNITGSSKKA